MSEDVTEYVLEPTSHQSEVTNYVLDVTSDVLDVTFSGRIPPDGDSDLTDLLCAHEAELSVQAPVGANIAPFRQPQQFSPNLFGFARFGQTSAGQDFGLTASAAVVVGMTFTGGGDSIPRSLLRAIIISILNKGLNQAGVHF